MEARGARLRCQSVSGRRLRRAAVRPAHVVHRATTVAAIRRARRSPCDQSKSHDSRPRDADVQPTTGWPQRPATCSRRSRCPAAHASCSHGHVAALTSRKDGKVDGEHGAHVAIVEALRVFHATLCTLA
eukprot:7315410-Prymnesium_polylepis.1